MNLGRAKMSDYDIYMSSASYDDAKRIPLVDPTDCDKYGHSLIKVYFRPWWNWFRKVEDKRCLYCDHREAL